MVFGLHCRSPRSGRFGRYCPLFVKAVEYFLAIFCRCIILCIVSDHSWSDGSSGKLAFLGYFFLMAFKDALVDHRRSSLSDFRRKR